VPGCFLLQAREKCRSRQAGPTTDPEWPTDGSGRVLLAQTGNLLPVVWRLIGPMAIGAACLEWRYLETHRLFPQGSPDNESHDLRPHKIGERDRRQQHRRPGGQTNQRIGNWSSCRGRGGPVLLLRAIHIITVLSRYRNTGIGDTRESCTSQRLGKSAGPWQLHMRRWSSDTRRAASAPHQLRDLCDVAQRGGGQRQPNQRPRSQQKLSSAVLSDNTAAEGENWMGKRERSLPCNLKIHGSQGPFGSPLRSPPGMSSR
jgi:hypothetical protein